MRHPDGRIEHPGCVMSQGHSLRAAYWPVIVVAICVIAVLYYGVWRFYWWQAGAQEAGRNDRPIRWRPVFLRVATQPRLEQLDRMTAGKD